MAHKLVVKPEAVLVRCGFAAGAWRAAEQANAGGSLKNVGRKGTAVDVKLDAQVSGVGGPGNLVAGVQHHRLGDETYKYRAFRHFLFFT